MFFFPSKINGCASKGCFHMFYLTNNSTYILDLQSGELSMDVHVNTDTKIHHIHIHKEDFILESMIPHPQSLNPLTLLSDNIVLRRLRKYCKAGKKSICVAMDMHFPSLLWKPSASGYNAKNCKSD
uniref:Uncharacterized protein n=1 Tax=Micrurus paraensis TaxID=1970185 RepID=A0A2D4JSC7_9SAUR